MLSIDEARDIVLAAVRPLPAESVPLAQALDRVLAAPVVAAHDVPRFVNSAMDGFALQAGPADRTLRIVGESRAGHPATVALGPGEAIRISTGAQVPRGADAVVMVERTTEREGTVRVEAGTTPDQNLRHAGEDMRAGTTVLQAGLRVGPAELGVAANAGVATLRCVRRPRVVVLATGDELVVPGGVLGPGQIHDSNALTLSALARRAGAEVAHAGEVPDTPQSTEAAVRAAFTMADVVLCSGGVSVGEHDHVKPAYLRAGVEERFWRVALRPGKPTWFGTRGPQLAFGLPGNPVSAMVTFLLFARPALLALQGADPGTPRERRRLTVAVPRHEARDECVRVRLDGDEATPTGPQASHVLTSMLGADALAIIPRGTGELAVGSTVEVERLPA
ncbi:MAG: molybdopterin molybdotransferase MoeA [Solirubrobacterales bacterium]|nr:molybdopterin molybdotransferase MoeA [Solirubrobacterales bacterium]